MSHKWRSWRVCGSITIAAALAWTVGCAKKSAEPAVSKPRPIAATRLAVDSFPADELISTIRNNSVHSATINWEFAEPELRARISWAATDEEKCRAIVGLLARMNDVHSVLTYRGRSFSHYEGVDESARAKLLPMMERQRAQVGKPVARLLDGGIGYVVVPGMHPANADELRSLSAELAGCVERVAAQKPAGWIVDLRLNGGGNVYPMLVGLHHLLGDGVAGGTRDADGLLVQEWVLKGDGLYWRDAQGDRRFAESDPPARQAEPNAFVAVLVGPLTASSGQATALAFKARPNCVLIGEPTARGYSTVLNPIRINDETTLSLAVGAMADRTGTAYPSVVLPEKTVAGGDDFDNPGADAKVLAAIEWLKQQSK